MKIAGILLIIAGVVALIGGISYTSKDKAVDMGPLQIYTTEHHYIPVPAVLGFVAILGGGALLYASAKQLR